MRNRLQYRIAEHSVVVYSAYPERISKKLSGFGSFLVSADNAEPFLQFYIESKNSEPEESSKEGEFTTVHTFDLEQDCCRLSRQGSRYLFTIEEREGGSPVELTMEIGSPRVRCRLKPDYKHLKFSLWMAMAFVGIPRRFTPVHSSVIAYNNRAIMFLGEAGTGKSTHTKLWLQHIPGSVLLNDDSPILRIEAGKPYVYGSPWSGKGRRYVNEKYPVKAFVRLKQHPHNKIDRLNKLESFGALYPSFPPAYLKDEYLEEHICTIISKIITSTPVYMLHCLPNQEAAEMAWETVYGVK